MLFCWSIRNKFRLGVLVLILVVGTVATIRLHRSHSYRWLVRSRISYQRDTDLRLVADISWNVGELRAIISRSCRNTDIAAPPIDRLKLREDFFTHFSNVKRGLDHYKAQLRDFAPEQKRNPNGDDQLPGWESVREVEQSLELIAKLNDYDDWALNEARGEELESALAELHASTMRLLLSLNES